MLRLRLPLVVLLLMAALATPAAASTDAYLPRPGAVFAGVASGDSLTDFAARTGSRPAVWEQWVQWGRPFRYALDRAQQAGTRLMLHVSLAPGQNEPGVITPGEIARGAGDAYLLELNRTLAAYGRPVYLRVMGEMNNCDLSYAPVDCDGSRRSGDHSAAQFRQAWRRIALIVRGGDTQAIDVRLRSLRMPALRASGALPRPPVALVWSPMTHGSPMIGALEPQRFWPGSGYVDWTATSFYSRFPNFRWLTPFYERFAARYGKPFAFAEWALWGADDAGFVRQLFGWTRRHPRTRMMIYNQGAQPAGPFRLTHFPRAGAILRRELASPRFAAL